jgi:hypothetical protein
MFGPWSVYGFLLVGVLFVVSMFRSAKSYGGSKSGTLALLRGTFAVGLIIALVDTGNDLSIAVVQNQQVPPPPTLRSKLKDLKDKARGKKPSRSSRRRSRLQNRPTAHPAKASAAARNSTDRKYEFLYGAMLLAVFLYILCQPHTWDFATNFLRVIILAFKGVDANASSRPPPITPEDSNYGVGPLAPPPDEVSQSAMQSHHTEEKNVEDSGH